MASKGVTTPGSPVNSANADSTPSTGRGSQDVIIQGIYGSDEASPWAGFSDKTIRAGFVRKVYGILLVQLAFTFGVASLFTFHEGTKIFVRQNIWSYWVAYAAFFVIYIALVCSNDLRRKYPHNIICLGLFTGAMSFMVGTITSFHDTYTVLIAVGITCVVCLAVTLFSFYSKFDLTSCGGFLFVASLVLLMFGIGCIIWPNKWAVMLYSAAGALLFSIFLAYDTQLIMGGKKYAISPEEHIFAAIQLYLDVVYIFLYILTLVGGGRR